MTNRNDRRTGMKMMASAAAALVLTLCLCLTTYALVMVSVSIPDHHFQTGAVAIDLNGGRAVISETDFLFEPGMTVNRDFYIQNNSTAQVYYRLYFDEVSGGLADVLYITVQDGQQTLLSGTASSLSRNAVSPAQNALGIGEKRVLTISFHYPETAGNDTQEKSLAFRLCADAVQTQNNPDRLFD